jgi:hypothetical protein
MVHMGEGVAWRISCHYHNLSKIPVSYIYDCNIEKAQRSWFHNKSGPLQDYICRPGLGTGWRLATRGPLMDGTRDQAGSPSRMFSFRAWQVWPESVFCSGVPGKLFEDFRPWEFILDSEGIRAGGVQIDAGNGQKSQRMVAVSVHFNDRQPTNGQSMGRRF